MKMPEKLWIYPQPSEMLIDGMKCYICTEIKDAEDELYIHHDKVIKMLKQIDSTAWKRGNRNEEYDCEELIKKYYPELLEGGK
jgi:hypothetical protein